MKTYEHSIFTIAIIIYYIINNIIIHELKEYCKKKISEITVN